MNGSNAYPKRLGMSCRFLQIFLLGAFANALRVRKVRSLRRVIVKIDFSKCLDTFDHFDDQEQRKEKGCPLKSSSSRLRSLS